MRAEALKKTVDEFNAACDAGVDEKFGRPKSTLRPIRKGPFYAVPLFAGGSNTKGGLSTDAERRVLNWARKPLKASMLWVRSPAAATAADCLRNRVRQNDDVRVTDGGFRASEEEDAAGGRQVLCASLPFWLFV